MLEVLVHVTPVYIELPDGTIGVFPTPVDRAYRPERNVSDETVCRRDLLSCEARLRRHLSRISEPICI